MPVHPENKRKRTPFSGRRLLKILVIVYCSAGIALYYLQEKLMFHPKPLAPDYRFKFNIPFKEVNIALNKNDNLNVVQFFTGDPIPRGVVLYFHGNRENVNRYAKYAVNFTSRGYQVWIADYPGYGKTTGRLTEENLYFQAKELYKLASSKFDKEHIIVYGKSLGSGIASYLASKKGCRWLILETPYPSIPDLLWTYAPFYPVNAMSRFKLPTAEYLKEVTIPVTIFHGNEDRTIPYSCATKLRQYLKPGDEFITINKGSHNNLNDFRLFQEKLDSIFSL
jgi:uncharacterized protein